MGGLGNQMFQAAHTISQGLKHDRECIFIPKSHTPGQGNSIDNYIHNIFKKLKFVDQIIDYVRIDEPNFEYSKVEPVSQNTVFYGYYQSTKNWYGYNEIIRDIFSPTEEYIKSMYSKYPELLNDDTLSIHVRLSEYLAYPSIHPVITEEYIREAVNKIGEYSKIFIFSDDHTWVKGNLNWLNNVILIKETHDWEELWLMSLCKNNIISNSTFSWWGSFLNKNINKKIIAPSVWFGPDGPNPKDIYEDYWNIINCELTDNFKILPK